MANNKRIEPAEQVEQIEQPETRVQEVQKSSTNSVKFRKEKLLTFKKYANRVDLLNVLLDGEKDYGFDEVDAIIANFLKGKVK